MENCQAFYLCQSQKSIDTNKPVRYNTTYILFKNHPQHTFALAIHTHTHTKETIESKTKIKGKKISCC